MLSMRRPLRARIALRSLAGVHSDRAVRRERASGAAAPGLRAKRVIDVALAAGGLLLAAPVLLVAVLLIRVDSPGAAVFRQVRVGQGGRPFRIYKLRTMHVDADERIHRHYVAGLIEGRAEANGGMYKLVGDPRMTRVGTVLRRWSIDELPQLWNVLRGEMSLVGPRPPLPDEVALYDDDARRRLDARPGLTGLWQVSGRCELSFDEMVRLDVEYWRSWHLARDLWILARTPWAVLSRRGAA